MISYTTAYDEEDICTDTTWNTLNDLIDWYGGEVDNAIFRFEWDGISAESITEIKKVNLTN